MPSGSITDVNAVPAPKWVIKVLRLRVALGFGFAVAGFWLAQPSWPSLAFAVGIGLVGECLRFWAAGHLEKGVEITTSGPYRWMKHPLYVGSSLLGAAFAVASRHMGASVLILLYVAGLLSTAARVEEANLRTKFGPAYERYASGVTANDLRRFSFSRARRNGEVRSVFGFVAVLALLAAKVVLVG